MKKLLYLVLVLFCSSSLFAQNYAKLISSNESETVITFSLNDYSFQKVNTQNGEELLLSSSQTSPLMIKDAPDLQQMTASIIIPDLGNSQIEVIGQKYVELNNINIAPSKGNLTRDIDPSTVAYNYGKVYQEDNFFPGKLASLETPYIVRDFRGQTVHIYPFQYNPVTNTLRVYSEVTVKVTFNKSTGVNEFLRTKSFNSISTDFNKIYQSFFINYVQGISKYTPVEEEGNMLIICADSYMDEMAPFVTWKNTIGRPTQIVAVSTIGSTAAAIKTYVTNYYNTNGLTYLLLVGDAAQIPTNSGSGLGGDSDNAYAYITGNDHYLEFFVGRFSAETEAQVTTQVQRTITYEDGSALAAGWLNKTIGIGSDQGPGDDNEYDYQHIRNQQTKLVNFTYVTPTIEIFDGSQGGNDVAGDATDVQVATAVNTGAGIITYCGHGSDFSFVTSGFDVTDANNLTNDNKLPFVFSVACVNGNFVGQTCFAEAWLRSENNGNPAGAIGFYGSTINQSWAPPMIGQDEMIDILVESYQNNIKRTLAGIAVNGMFKMNEESSDFDMTDTWTCFGDPSVMVRTDNPLAMTVTNSDVLIVGSTTYSLSCDFDGALACLSKDGVILGTAYVTSGTANITLTGTATPGDNLTLAVTGFNKITFQDVVTVISPSSPYVIISDYTPSTLNYGETLVIDADFANVATGNYNAANVSATLSTTDPYITIVDGNATVGSVNASDTVSVIGAFTIQFANNVPDGHVANLSVAITGQDAKYDWSSSIMITANAPEFEVISYEITEGAGADNNGRLDPGEIGTITFTIENTGNADASDVNIDLSGTENSTPYLNILNANQNIDLAVGQTEVTFDLSVSENAVQGDSAILVLNVEKNNAYIAEGNAEFVIGQPSVIIIGTGTTESTTYPLYNYYENNKTQILFLSSELTPGTIEKLSLFVSAATPGGYTFNNFTIKLMETSTTALASAYVTTTSATTVYSNTALTLNETTGELVFDITDFNYSGSQNLLVEIFWGDNGAYCSYNEEYKVYCTTTSSTTVVYGYADSETPPAYDGNSTSRPNMAFYYPAQNPTETFDITFTVNDNNSQPITNANVMLGSTTKPVDSNGECIFNIAAGDYNYSVTANGYVTVASSVNVANDSNITVVLAVNSIIVNDNLIKFYPNPTTSILNIELSNSEKGSLTLVDINGKVVLSQILDSKTTQVDLSNVAKGIYILNLNIDGEVLQNKIIVK